jgi:hypothetical protein
MINYSSEFGKLPECLKKHTDDVRAQGMMITDEELYDIYLYCLRKMQVANISAPEEYIHLLYPDEVRNYAVRHGVNATVILREMEKRACVQNVG